VFGQLVELDQVADKLNQAVATQNSNQNTTQTSTKV
jgi:hypothetical protein